MDTELIDGTTGGFRSVELAKIEETLTLEKFDISDAIEIGKIALAIGEERKLSMAVEVRIGVWVVFHASLPDRKSTRLNSSHT